MDKQAAFASMKRKQQASAQMYVAHLNICDAYGDDLKTVVTMPSGATLTFTGGSIRLKRPQ